MHQTLHHIIVWSALIILFPTISASQGLVTLHDPLDSLAGRYNYIPEEYSGFRGLIIEETDVTHYYPIIPYIYFDSGSGAIPSRYILFTDAAQTLSFDETQLSGGTLDIHHHFLNILGSRLRRYSWLRVSIVGCNSQEPESGENITTSAVRAKTVYEYLRVIWRISEDQIVLLPARNSPEKPSNKLNRVSRAENRRVEVDDLGASRSWEFFQPIRQSGLRSVLSSSSIGLYFYIRKSPGALQQFMEVRRGGKLWHRIDLRDSIESLLLYNWTNNEGDYPVADSSEFSFQCVVVDYDSSELRSNELKIPVLYISKDRARTEFRTARTLFVLSLAQGIFGEDYHLGEYNHQILNAVACSQFQPRSRITIFGHIGVILPEWRSARPSQHFAAECYKMIKISCGLKHTYETLDERGEGISHPLYDISLPEGRQLNKGVELIIDVPGIISNER